LAGDQTPADRADGLAGCLQEPRARVVSVVDVVVVVPIVAAAVVPVVPVVPAAVPVVAAVPLLPRSCSDLSDSATERYAAVPNWPSSWWTRKPRSSKKEIEPHTKLTTASSAMVDSSSRVRNGVDRHQPRLGAGAGEVTGRAELAGPAGSAR